MPQELLNYFSKLQSAKNTSMDGIAEGEVSYEEREDKFMQESRAMLTQVRYHLFI